MGSSVGYGRCDGCGKRRLRTEMHYIAYRASVSRSGPWLAERLCTRCRQWYMDCGIWSVRLLEMHEQVERGLVWVTRPMTMD